MSILQNIHGHTDLVGLSDAQRIALCNEIREFVVSHVAATGGHLASNLGVVELSVAIETVFDTNIDRLVFDVGHQSYIHKLLTGRQADFERLRMFGGMSGFPKPSESNTDSFVAGHASSSVSIALGMARARKLTGQNYQVIALMGDGAATGGMAYEGLNDAGGSREKMIVILNDNEMSIDRNVGGMARHLSKLRTQDGYFNLKKKYRRIVLRLPAGKTIYRFTHNLKEHVKRSLLGNTIFENMGFEYLGPVDGHDVKQLIRLLWIAKNYDRPVLLHVITHKGHGFQPAESDPSRFHGIGKFDPADGHSLGTAKVTFSNTFGQTMIELAQENPRLCAITAAMPGGTGLVGFKQQFPDRLFDVGIAEEHAVSMAGGLAKQGAVPVVALYSTFLQRSYDQVMQDIALLGLHVVLAVDRAGLVGEDGPTHHGAFDVGYLRQVPGIRILAPASQAELKPMLHWAVNEYTGPIVVRYPRGGDGFYTGCAFDPANPVVCHRTGTHVVLVSYGIMINNVLAAAEQLEQSGIEATVLRLTQVHPLPVEQISARLPENMPIVIIEETATGAGIKESLAWEIRKSQPGARIHGIDLGPDFVPHGDPASLHKLLGLDAGSIANFVREVLSDEE